MTPLRILGPPRHGRQVKSEAQVLEEMKNLSNSSDHGSCPPAKDVPHVNSVHHYFGFPGRFVLGGITKEDNYYIFHDLELPMGCWTELALHADIYRDSSKSQNDWAKYTGMAPNTGLIPADISYGLMAVCCFYQREPSIKDLIQEIQQCVLIPDLNELIRPILATRVDYEMKAPATIFPGVGWPASHPFGVSYSADVTCKDSEPESIISNSNCSLDSSIQLVLENLLGENNPEMAVKVIGWGASRSSVKLIREKSSAKGQRAAVIGAFREAGYISAAGLPNLPAHARAIRADPNHYLKQ